MASKKTKKKSVARRTVKKGRVRVTQKEDAPNCFRELLKKNWKTLLAGTLSLVAIAVSVRSCQIAKRANQIAQHALETTAEQFYQENKPYIVLRPRKYDKLQSYYKYTLLPEQNAVQIAIQYEIRNIGKVAAKDVAVYDKLQVGQSPTQPEITGFNLPNRITLGPSENYVLGVTSSLGWDNKDSYDKYVQKLSSEKGPEITIKMGVTYLSEINPEQSFNSAIVSTLTKQRAKLVRMEHECAKQS